MLTCNNYVYLYVLKLINCYIYNVYKHETPFTKHNFITIKKKSKDFMIGDFIHGITKNYYMFKRVRRV